MPRLGTAVAVQHQVSRLGRADCVETAKASRTSSDGSGALEYAARVSCRNAADFTVIGNAILADGRWLSMNSHLGSTKALNI